MPLPRFVTRAGMSDIDDCSPLSLGRIGELLRATTLPAIVDWSSRVAARLCMESEPYDKAIQMELVDGLTKPGGRLRRKIKAFDIRNGARGYIAYFDEPQVLLALRLAVVVNANCAMPGVAPKPDTFAQALIGLNDHLKYEDDLADDESVLRNILPDMLFRTHDSPVDSLGRWKLLLDDMPRVVQQRGKLQNYDLGSEFRKAAGVAVADHRALTAGLSAVFHALRTERPLAQAGHAVRWSHWTSKYELADSEWAHVSGLVATPHQFQSEFQDLAPAGEAPYEFLPFRRHPVLRVEDLVWLVDERFLHDMATVGVYHRLFTHYVAAGAKAERNLLSDLLGHAFEEYVGLLLRETYRGTEPSDILRLDDEVGGYGSSVCDFALLEGDTLLLLECKSHLITQDAAVRANIDRYKQDLEKTVGIAAGQLMATIDSIDAGRVTLRGVNPKSLRRYLPVVVTLQNIPHDYFTGQIISTEAAKSGLAVTTPRRLRLQVLDVATLEQFGPHSSPTERLTDLLAGKCEEEDRLKHPVSSWNHFAGRFHSHRPNPLLREATVRATDEMREFWHSRERPLEVGTNR